MAAANPQAGPAAVRLVFAYGPDGIELRERQPLVKQAPPSSEVDPAVTSGVFVEVRRADDSVLYRRTVPVAMPTHAEIFDPSGSPQRVSVPGPATGTFDVVVPDHVAAADVVVLASRDRLPESLAPTFEAMAGPEAAGGASPIQRFSFRAGGDGND